MIDDDLDTRLHEAGARWRAATDDPTDRLSVRDAAPRRQWWLLASVAVLVAVLAATAVKLADFGDPHRRSGAPPISDVTWHARSVLPATRNGNLPADHDQPLSATAYLRFANGRFTGSDGCNALGGKVSFRATTMTFADTHSTEVGCTGADVVARILTGTAQYSVTSAALTIYQQGAGTLFLSRDPAPPRQPVQLTGVWLLTGVQTTSKDGSTGSGTSVSPTGRGNQLVIGSNGTVAFDDQCPLLRGRFTVRGDRLALRGTTAETGACPARSDAADARGRRAFIARVLSGTVRWQVDGRQLTITRGTRGLTFDRNP